MNPTASPTQSSSEPSHSLTYQLSLIRSRLRKVADNLFQSSKSLPQQAPDWNTLLSKLNMSLSHLETLESPCSAMFADQCELATESESSLRAVLVEPAVVTPDPLTIPSVLLRKKCIPDVECQQEMAFVYSNGKQLIDIICRCTAAERGQ